MALKNRFFALLALICAPLLSAHDGDFSAGSILQPSGDFLSVNATLGYESEYVFRGIKQASYSIRPSADVAYNILGFDAYAGLALNQPLKGQLDSKGALVNLQKLDLYAGAMYAYGPVTIDVGYIYYWYCGETANLSRDSEIYVGASFDLATFLDGLNISPAIYYYYDFELLRNTIEASISYEMQLDDYLPLEGFSLPLKLYYGYTSASSANGDQIQIRQDLSSSYMYAGGELNLAYQICDYAKIKVGLRYAQAFNCYGTLPEKSQRNLWYGMSLSVGF